ncbi:MAG: hypothetical protein KKI02_04115, partial [Planctomycetes bacterium]|nr:hypothetical protein [Planctomycetota bacterium]
MLHVPTGWKPVPQVEAAARGAGRDGSAGAGPGRYTVWHGCVSRVPAARGAGRYISAGAGPGRY